MRVMVWVTGHLLIVGNDTSVLEASALYLVPSSVIINTTPI